MHDWDDEENFIEDESENDEAAEDAEDDQGTDKLSKSDKAAPAVSVANESDQVPTVSAPRRLKKTKSQASVSSNHDDASVKEKKRAMLKMPKRRLAGFFEDEAELGSDDEEHDDANTKAINRQDVEENEEGLDSDLEGFIDHTKDGRGDQAAGGDDQEIEDLEEAARLKFMQDMHNDDKLRTKLAMEAAIYGRKKRNRAEAGLDDLEDMDEYERRKLERIKERE